MKPLRVLLETLEPPLLNATVNALLSSEPQFTVLGRDIPTTALVATAERVRPDCLLCSVPLLGIPPVVADLMNVIPEAAVVGVQPNARLVSIHPPELGVRELIAMIRAARAIRRHYDP